ncbi:hypothetical protein [Alteribacillus bidgolensis]|uniref:Uncharacterized protein n=1 Tax=Alteribacillus bidgolensis TaxID=930129 RepID=A0A1G8EF90_9BACI|nr:hypothetical protein [Alteribacillus bidgolensis]SDH68583.1 hypothetical protein SAMN05216352_102202 [Alteribacillus bidgolensis]
MLDKKRNKIAAGAVILLVLFILLEDRVFPILTLCLAGISFYAGAKLLKKEQSKMMIGTGLGFILAGAFILTGGLPVFITITGFVIVLYVVRNYLRRKKADSTVISS